MPQFICQVCEEAFSVPEAALEKYPGWEPKYCREHSPAKKEAKKRVSKRTPSRAEENLTLAEVLEKYTGGPGSGVFTDGSSNPNPGPGGWGWVWVEKGKIVSQGHGHDSGATTNNRMELAALIAAFETLPTDCGVTVYSDSQLCVKTVNEWAAGWEKRGWRRKSGPIANLELVQKLYALAQAHPDVTLKWIKAHDGSRWNEYADALASAYMLE